MRPRSRGTSCLGVLRPARSSPALRWAANASLHFAQQCRATLIFNRTDNGDFLHTRHQHVNGVERLAEGLWVAAQGLNQQAQRVLSRGLIAPFARPGRQAQQLTRQHGTAGRRGVVLQVARPHNERFVVIAGIEKAALLRAKMCQSAISQFARSCEPALVKGRLV